MSSAGKDGDSVAKMKFGPWVRQTAIALKPHQFYDVVTFNGPYEWIKPEMVMQARFSDRGWETTTQALIGQPVRWIRERSWCEPQDLDVSAVGHRQALELAHNRDGSGRVVMYDAGEVLGEITIPANQFETIAAWFAQAHRSNQL